jgi:hypothetical protein
VLIRALHPRTLMLFEGEGGGGGEGSGNGAATTFTQEQVNDLLAREKGKITSKYGDYDALKTAASELATLKAASQSDIERITSERDSLKGQHGSLSAENMRLKVALEKGLTGDKAVLADRLTGATVDEMKADADKLLQLFGGAGSSTGFDGGARGNGSGQQKTMDDLIRGARP